MGYIEGEKRNQGTLFPVVLDDFVPADHMCRVIEAFVGTLVMFGRSIAAEIALHSAEVGEVIRENAAMKKLAAQFNSVTL
jgi:hypothetical protein